MEPEIGERVTRLPSGTGLEDNDDGDERRREMIRNDRDIDRVLALPPRVHEPEEPDEGDLFWEAEIPPEVTRFHDAMAKRTRVREKAKMAREHKKMMAEMTLEHDNMLRRARYKVGYHCGEWPPKPIGTKLTIRTLPHMGGMERDIQCALQVCKFYRRPRYIEDEDKDGVVVVVDDDQGIDEMMVVFNAKKFRVVTVRNSDIRMNCQASIQEKVSIYKRREAQIFLCTMLLENYRMIPYAKLTLVRNVTDGALLEYLASRQSDRARIRYEPSFIDVFVTPFDDIQVINTIVTMAIYRNEYPTEKQFDYFETHHWKGNGMRQKYQMAMESEMKTAEEEKKELLLKIGPYFERWWNDYPTIDKVRKYVKPKKEHVNPSPLVFRRGCARFCDAFMRWICDDPTEPGRMVGRPSFNGRPFPRPEEEKQEGVESFLHDWQRPCFTEELSVFEEE